MELFNDTRGETATPIVTDKDGRQFLAVIVKYTFDVPLGGLPRLAEQQNPVDLVDTYSGDEAGEASIRRPSQVFDRKPGTDVILLGHAHARQPGRDTQVDVMLRMANVTKVVRAHGLRVWQKGAFGGLKPGPAMPIRAPIPLIYELAWGGADRSDPLHPVGELRNLVGRGISKSHNTLVDQPAAQLEDPEAPIGGPRPRPAAFGPIHRHWEPRCRYAGTYDEDWKTTRMPFLPVDFDDRFHVCVPEDQFSAVPLHGNEPIEVLGATPDGLFSCQLPRLALGFASVTLGRRTEHRTHLDTVLIDTDARQVELTYRAAIPIPKKLQMIERIMAFEKKVL